MTINALKVVKTWAEIYHDGIEFRVYPDGTVNYWAQDAEQWLAFYEWEHDFDQILAAGMQAINS